ncbi:MAG: DUF4405 domain-containing protein [Chloroflexi bacterium]|jgi:hypothetical protein|nr:DUF4405 domain-containing protein [Chloroflexota bacterium]
MNLKARTRFWLDLLLFISFLAFMEPVLTGVPLHEWWATAAILAFLIHVLTQWDWILAVGKRFFQKLFHQSRLNFVLDLLLFLSMTTVVLSGLMISEHVLPALGFPEQRNFFWRRIHDASANLSLLIVAIHVGLHWDWILGTARRLFPFGKGKRPSLLPQTKSQEG